MMMIIMMIIIIIIIIIIMKPKFVCQYKISGDKTVIMN